MAERRMFTRKVTDDDNFMALSSSAQALYLHLSMSADDDGFCNQVSISMFKAHASVQDLEALLEKRYIYQFENGVIVIKHWRMANALRKDRYTRTTFQEELKQLKIKDNGVYTLNGDDNQMATVRQPNGNQMATQDSIGKDRVDKESIGEGKRGSSSPPRHRYGEYQNVLLSDQDIEKLKAELPGEYESYIERLSSYMASSGKSYKSHLATIRNWARRDKEKNPAKSRPNDPNDELNEQLIAMLEGDANGSETV